MTSGPQSGGCKLVLRPWAWMRRRYWPDGKGPKRNACWLGWSGGVPMWPIHGLPDACTWGVPIA